MKKQSLLIVILVIMVISLFVGYRTFLVSSDIFGRTAEANNIDVAFSKIGNIRENNSEKASATISDDGKVVIINIPRLLGKDAYAEIPISIKNNGSFSAKLYSISENGINKNAPISITYTGIGVTDNPILPGNEVTFVVKILCNKDLEQYSESAELGIIFNYVQS